MFIIIYLFSAVNRARGRATRMSSILGEYRASRAVDGNIDTYMHTATHRRTAWWWVRLDTTSAIEKIHMSYRNDCKFLANTETTQYNIDSLIYRLFYKRVLQITLLHELVKWDIIVLLSFSPSSYNGFFFIFSIHRILREKNLKLLQNFKLILS